MIESLSIAVYAFVSRVSMSFSLDETPCESFFLAVPSSLLGYFYVAINHRKDPSLCAHILLVNGKSSWRNNNIAWVQLRGQRVRTLVVLIRLLTYVWKRYKHTNPPNYGLHSITGVFRQGWPWHHLTHEVCHRIFTKTLNLKSCIQQSNSAWKRDLVKRLEEESKQSIPYYF